MSIESNIRTKADSVPPLGSTLKFDFGDETVMIDGTGEENVVSTNDTDADCTISVSKEDLESVMNGDLNAMAAVMGGKMKISGDMSVAMKLQSLFS